MSDKKGGKMLEKIFVISAFIFVPIMFLDILTDNHIKIKLNDDNKGDNNEYKS